MYLSCHWWTHCQFSQFKNWLVLSPVHLWGRPSGEYVYERQVPPQRQECTLGSSSATSGSMCPPRPNWKVSKFLIFFTESISLAILCVHLVLGYQVVLVHIGEEPTVFATLKSTVVSVHVASLLSFSVLPDIPKLKTIIVSFLIFFDLLVFLQALCLWWVVTFCSPCWDPDNFQVSMFSNNTWFVTFRLVPSPCFAISDLYRFVLF